MSKFSSAVFSLEARACFLGLALGLIAHPGLAASSKGPAWPAELEKRLGQIDGLSPGSLGVYVKRLSDDTEMNYHGDSSYYLSSTVKVPVAVALLKRVEEGKLKLDQELILKKTDFVDGSGEVLWKEPGAVMSLG
ncbi:MAG: hypothetical protein EOP11_21305, partial [Proteobacteria bacterium]